MECRSLVINAVTAEVMPVLVVDVTTVTIDTGGTWPGLDSKFVLRRRDGGVYVQLGRKDIRAAGGDPHEVLLAAFDHGTVHGVLTSTPMSRGRIRVPIVWYVPGTNTAKLGPSDSDGPTVHFKQGVAIDAGGAVHAVFNTETGIMTDISGQPIAEVMAPADADDVSRQLAAYA